MCYQQARHGQYDCAQCSQLLTRQRSRPCGPPVRATNLPASSRPQWVITEVTRSLHALGTHSLVCTLASHVRFLHVL